MNILVGCEESGILRDALIALGHNAVSCDLLPTRRPGPHYQGDIRDVLYRAWDAAFFFPPCTYLSVSSIHWNDRGRGWQGTYDALDFVTLLWNAKHIPLVRLENPVGVINTRLDFMPRPQIVQPYQFGDDASKTTCLWARGLPPLAIDPAKRKGGRWVEWPRGSGKMVERWANQTDSGQNKLPPSKDRALKRSETYPGIAHALATTWGT